MTSETWFDAVICVKDMAPFIAETLENLESLEVPPRNIYVIDDGSTDETARIASRFSTVVLLQNEGNKGKSYSRNCGITTSKAPFIQLIDADDLLAPDKTRLQLEYLLQHPEVDAVMGDVDQFVVVNGEKQYRTKVDFSTMTDLLEDLIRKNRTALHAYFFRRSYFEKAGLFDERFVISQDRELWIRALLRGAKVEYVSGPLAHYRRHETSTIASQRAEAAYHNARALQIHKKELYSIHNGKYKGLTAEILRMLARNANIFGLTWDFVDSLIEDAESAGVPLNIQQNAFYALIERFFGGKLTERILRPKFKLDHWRGKYGVRY